MSFVQADCNHLPPSPLSSGAPKAYSDETQLGFIFHERLKNKKISDTEIARLISQYNRQSIPIIRDEDFCERLHQQLTNSGKIDDLEVARSLLDESDRIAKDWDAARWDIKMADSDFFDTGDQATHFIMGTHRGNTVQGHNGLLAYALPFLIEQARRQKNKPAERKRSRERRRKSARIMKQREKKKA